LKGYKKKGNSTDLIGDAMTSNSRKRQRIEFKDRILCYKHIITSVNAKPDPSPIRIHIQDISHSGLGIICNRDLGMGDYLLFNLESGGSTMEFMVEVKWCRYGDGAFYAGLHFLNLTKDHVIFLDGLIKSYIKKQMRMTDPLRSTGGAY